MKLTVIYAGMLEYSKALAFQEELVAKRQKEEIPDTLVILEHPPVLTLGRHGKEEDILLSSSRLRELGVQTSRISRGGDVTYHGPGQLVGYPIIHLYKEAKSLRRLVDNLEQVCIQYLDTEHSIPAGRDSKHRGVWVGDKKITAIGLSIHHSVTMHGFAFNVQPDLSHFGWIIPCGIADKGVTSLAELTGNTYDMMQVARNYAEHFRNIFGYDESEDQYWKSNANPTG